MLTRMFAYLTLFIYLVLGVAVVRLYNSEMTTIELSASYLKLFSGTHIQHKSPETIVFPDARFAKLEFLKERNEVKFSSAKNLSISKKTIATPPLTSETVTKTELHFHELIKLQPVHHTFKFETNLASHFKEDTIHSLAKSDFKTDMISTLQAAAKEEEPEFFEYKSDENAQKSPKGLSSSGPEMVQSFDNEQDINDTDEVSVDQLVGMENSKDQSKSGIKKEEPTTALKSASPGLVSMTSQMNQQDSIIAKGTQINRTQSSGVKTKTPNPPLPSHSRGAQEALGLIQESINSYHSQVTIQVTGTDLRKTNPEVGFEVRPQDDLSETMSDYNSGQVVLNQKLADDKMTRSVTILKRGFAPTNTDLILEEGASEISIPLIEEAVFNEMMAPYESRGALGGVLVELEDEVESASLDVPYSQVLKLNKEMQVTDSENFTYQLFIGVRAGNTLLSYRSSNGDVTSKIIHVHDHELTFETNFFENVLIEKISIVEEDLLAKEKSKLIIPSESIKHFATNKHAKKISDNTFATDFNRTLLGGRKYLELLHQQESVFVGFRQNSLLEIPSENFMKYILSKFENGKLGHRCLVQVNLNRKSTGVEVAAESAGENLMTSMQILDSDGKFYESVGDKSQKVIIVGENHGALENNQDAKINLKITYQDGSIQYLGTYCSPNTYLVEQL